MMDISFPGKYAAQLARNSGNVQVYKCQSEKSIGFVEISATPLQKICANPKWQSISPGNSTNNSLKPTMLFGMMIIPLRNQ